ncbi:MAG: malto-oligosyltrehalose trehalohydrolase, partial [Chloroflexi bacterium]|nr:malto-oligosyltrehalose trehalohydrolase [Chloroflexota bacterium]
MIVPEFTPQNLRARHLPIGAEVTGQGASFRIWAPRHSRVSVVIERGPLGPQEKELAAEGQGYFSGTLPEAGEGTLYRIRLDDDVEVLPDPASRFQPEGPLGPSQVIGPGNFTWSDQEWKGIEIRGQVLYEVHIGTFSKEGTWRGAERHLPALADIGITAIEVMPIADFPGRFGWGYDGVNLFAPSRLYGLPDDMRRFVDQAHSLGIGVILDVVYNHLGPVGNFLQRFSDWYFSSEQMTAWGRAINYDGPESAPVREFFTSNAAYWIREYHIDGLRLDAMQSIFDRSPEHIVQAVARAAHLSAEGRSVIVTVENELQQSHIIRPESEAGFGIDAAWDDDFHHAAMVALTGRREAYFLDYMGSPQEFVSSIKRGFLYQGQHSWQGQRRGTPATGIPPQRFIHYLQNHDQVANSAYGLRIDRLTSRGRYRAMTALLLLSPQTPLLFQGQEFAASAPFLFFFDILELKTAVTEGRKEFMQQFPSVAALGPGAALADPSEEKTFLRCKLDFTEVGLHRE